MLGRSPSQVDNEQMRLSLTRFRSDRYTAASPSQRNSNWVWRDPSVSDHRAASTEYTLSIVQKLFSMFPRGAPGLGLLLLRLFVGAVLLLDALAGASMHSGILVAVLVASALALTVGVLTPIAAALAALSETVGLTAFDAPIVLHSFASIAIALALALLGPGAYSVDARVFGRRLMEFGPRIE